MEEGSFGKDNYSRAPLDGDVYWLLMPFWEGPVIKLCQ